MLAGTEVTVSTSLIVALTQVDQVFSQCTVALENSVLTRVSLTKTWWNQLILSSQRNRYTRLHCSTAVSEINSHMRKWETNSSPSDAPPRTVQEVMKGCKGRRHWASTLAHHQPSTSKNWFLNGRKRWDWWTIAAFSVLQFYTVLRRMSFTEFHSTHTIMKSLNGTSKHGN